MRISDWSSDVCSSDLRTARSTRATSWPAARARSAASTWRFDSMASDRYPADLIARRTRARATSAPRPRNDMPRPEDVFLAWLCKSEEHTSELQSLMRISYAVSCLNKNTIHRKSKEDLVSTHNAPPLPSTYKH